MNFCLLVGGCKCCFIALHVQWHGAIKWTKSCNMHCNNIYIFSFRISLHLWISWISWVLGSDSYRCITKNISKCYIFISNICNLSNYFQVNYVWILLSNYYWTKKRMKHKFRCIFIQIRSQKRFMLMLNKLIPVMSELKYNYMVRKAVLNLETVLNMP